MKNNSNGSKVYFEIRKSILSCQLPPDTRLKEDEWAKKTGVSRMAVREALNRLLGENLVFLGEKSGFFVSGLSVAELKQIGEIRQILEVGAIELFIKNVNKSKINMLEKICEEFRFMYGNGYFNGACEADLKFHETILQISENDKLISIYQSSHVPLFHQQLFKSNTLLDDYVQTDREHINIVEAIKEKDFQKAKTCMILHLDRGRQDILSQK